MGSSQCPIPRRRRRSTVAILRKLNRPRSFAQHVHGNQGLASAAGTDLPVTPPRPVDAHS
jgi:predicted amidohydrolase YtcJ